MRVLARIGIYAVSESTDWDIQGLLTRYEPYCEEVKREYGSLRIYTDKPQHAQLLKEIEEKRLGYNHQLEIEYSKQELDSAEYLAVRPTTRIFDSYGDDPSLFYKPSCETCESYIYQHSDLKVVSKYAGK